MAYVFTPQIGYGGKLEVDTGYPGAANWVQVDGLDDFSISFETSEIEVTSRQNSTAGSRHDAKFLPGRTAIEADATFVFDPDEQALGATGGHGVTVYPFIGIMGHWKYTFADASTWEFTGFMRRPSFTMPREDKAMMEISWRLTAAANSWALPGAAGAAEVFTGDTD